MEIEYQNKNTITWCLERDGPPICLKATILGRELQSIAITSEDFSLEFEYDEARALIGILSQMTDQAISVPIIKTQSTRITDVSDITETNEIEPEPEPVYSEPDYSEPEPEPVYSEPDYSEPEPEPEPVYSEPDYSEPEPEPDYSEPEPVYSEPDYSEPEPDYSEPEPDYSEPEPEPEPVYSEPDYSEPEPVYTEPDYSEPEPESTESEYSEPESTEPKEPTLIEVETASFFRSEDDIDEEEEKSPLEQILEEEQGQDITEHEHQEPYSPSDFKDESFVSKFDTKGALDLIERLKSFPELEPEPESVETRIDAGKQEEPDRSPISEVERKKSIEKERAERRRRLWELTRGF